MKTIFLALIAFLVVLIVAAAALSITKKITHKPRPVILKSAPCPNGGLMVGKEFYPEGA